MTYPTIIGIPTRGNDLSVNLIMLINSLKYPVYFQQCNFSASLAQNLVFTTAFHKESNVIMLDSDVSTSPETIDKLISSGKDVISAPVFHYDINLRDVHVDVCLSGGIREGASEGRNYVMKSSGIEEIRHSSFSCIFISYNVLKAFHDNKESYTELNDSEKIEDENVTSDQVFYHKLKKLGFKAYVDWSCRDTTHSRVVDLNINSITRIQKLIRIE